MIQSSLFLLAFLIFHDLSHPMFISDISYIPIIQYIDMDKEISLQDHLFLFSLFTIFNIFKNK